MVDRRAFWMAIVFTIALILPTVAYADNASANNRWYYDEVQECKHDKGFTQGGVIKEGDSHYGWKIGKFVISGFTSRTQDETPIFLKNVGDQITLSFILEQDIDALNNEENYVVWFDSNGYDEYFGIPKTDFGRGMLIVRHTDYQNNTQEPVKYANYLDGVKVGAETVIDVFEEGDYEVALDYETRKPEILNIPQYHDYRIFFRFKVRNSNTMMFLFDTKSGNELFNGSVTENGFRIDTAGSHYLEIRVKKEVLNETEDGLVEDTRFNASATNGSEYTDPGIYTITTRNPSSGDEPTTKVVYVGDDDVLKATVANGMTVSEVQHYLQDGASVAEDGTLIQASAPVNGEGYDDPANESAAQKADNTKQEKDSARKLPILPALGGIIGVALLAGLLIIASKRRKAKPEIATWEDKTKKDGEGQ